MKKQLVDRIAIAFLAIVIALSLSQRYLSQVRGGRQRAYEHDQVVDSAFLKRTRQPLEVRLLLGTHEGMLIGEADRPSFQERIANLGKIPVILDLPGCGFPTWGKGVPDGLAMLHIDEDEKLLSRSSRMKACEQRDGKAIKVALTEQRDALMSYVKHASWIDKSRLMMTGTGESAPIVAAFSGLLKSRATLADPCLVRWSEVSSSSPLLMLLTIDPQGVYDGPMPQIDRIQAAVNRISILPSSLRCPGLPRPPLNAAKVIIAPGFIGAMDRPEALMLALQRAYEHL